MKTLIQSIFNGFKQPTDTANVTHAPVTCDVDKLDPDDRARFKKLCGQMGVPFATLRLNVGWEGPHVSKGVLHLPSNHLLSDWPDGAPADFIEAADAFISHELAHVKHRDEAVIRGIGWAAITGCLSFFCLAVRPPGASSTTSSVGVWSLRAAYVGLGVASLFTANAGYPYARFCERRADREASRYHKRGLLLGLQKQRDFRVEFARMYPDQAKNQVNAEGDELNDPFHPPISERIKALEA